MDHRIGSSTITTASCVARSSASSSLRSRSSPGGPSISLKLPVLLVLVVLTYLVFRSILFGTLDERRLAAFLLAAPAFLPHLAILGGEIDNFMYIPLLLSAWMLMRLRNHIGLLLVTLSVCVGLAIHEAFLLMFYPLLLALIIDLLHQRRLKAAAVAVHGAVVSLCFVVIIFFGKLHGERADWLHEAQGRTDMPIESHRLHGTAQHSRGTSQVCHPSLHAPLPQGPDAHLHPVHSLRDHPLEAHPQQCPQPRLLRPDAALRLAVVLRPALTASTRPRCHALGPQPFASTCRSMSCLSTRKISQGPATWKPGLA